MKLAAKFHEETQSSLLEQKAQRLGSLLVFAILVREREPEQLGAATEPLRSETETLGLETGTETGTVKLHYGNHNRICRCKQELADLDRQNMK